MNRAAEIVMQWLITTVLTAMLMGVAACADTVMLKTEAYVKGPKVLLGDIADIQGANAEALAAIEIGGAPSPGGSKRIDAGLLRMRLNTAGIDASDVELKGAPSVLTKTLALDVSKDVLVDDLRAFIETQMPWDPSETTIDILAAPKAAVVPDGNLAIRWMPNPQYRWVGPGVFRGELLVDGQVKETFTVRANVESYADVLTAASDIPRGQSIRTSDLRFEKRAMSQVKGDAVQDLDRAVGMVARSGIFRGEVLTNSHLTPKQIIKRNQTVTVESRAGGLVVRGRARAMDNGCAGDAITCLNVESKQTFQGVVRADGVVVVQ